ncbi:MAG TPA: sigma 54-interacting transcriptional regulator [Vicinamibacterales bacterium]|nr:sigma 54-interacting transcriptional regulator [Vicinamibacterales bacterium]
MRVFARRFLIDSDVAVDLATGAAVRLWLLDAGARDDRSRAAACDAVALLRHPLLLPPIDYGSEEGRWFEAYPAWPAVRAPAPQIRRAALHLARFLRAEAVVLGAEAAARAIRPAIESASGSARPLGWRLLARRSVDCVAAAFDGGPPGVRRVCLAGPRGSGLRTAHLQIARAGRLAGYVVLDRRVADGWHPAADLAAPHHVCVVDWGPASDELPGVLQRAAIGDGRPHLWIQFRRLRSPAPGAHWLEPLTETEMIDMLYVDAICGPPADRIARAAREAGGLPGLLVDALAARRPRATGVSWVHETSPAYLPSPPVPPGRVARPAAGVARLERALQRGAQLAQHGRRLAAERVLRRCVAAFEVRGATEQAALAACRLGDVRLSAGRADAAADAFARARASTAEPALAMRALVGAGRAALDRARFQEAEAAFRTVLASPASSTTGDAVAGLAEVLCWTGRADLALDCLATHRAAHGATVNARHATFAARAWLVRGDHAEAAREIARALAAVARDDEDESGRADVHLVAAAVQQHLGDAAGSSRHAAAAVCHARRARRTPAVLLARALHFRATAREGEPARLLREHRLRRAAAALPVLRMMEVRVALGDRGGEVADFVRRTGADGLVPPASSTTGVDLLETLLEGIYREDDEARALAAIIDHVRDRLDAGGIAIFARVDRPPLVCAGRSWPGDRELAEQVTNSGAPVLHDGVVRQAGAPVRYAGSTIAAIVGRWTVCSSSAAAIAQHLRIAAAAAAPLVRALLDHPDAVTGADEFPDQRLGPGVQAGAVREAIRRAAPAPYPVLIEGESGSGKELVARALHARSARRARRFCAVNCAAFADDLLEAELFGHARGAFTGAALERPGLFEDADGGTLFLDEVTELSPRAQAKLLRVLQEGEIRRVGENLSRRVDVRLLAATNRPLAAEAAAGRFRPDLRFRLDVVRIGIPPLRDRPDDVPWLAARFWADAAARVGTRATLGPDVMAALARYDWPGNVRELQNVLSALAVAAPRRGRVPAAALPVHVASLAASGVVGFEEARAEFERRFIRAALARAGGHRSAAAAQLGLTRQGFAKMIKRLGIVEVP